MYTRYAESVRTDNPRFQAAGMFLNNWTHAGPKLGGSREFVQNGQVVVPINALVAAIYVCFVSFAIKEDRPGDCQIFLNELGSTESNEGGPFMPSRRARNHGQLTRASGDNFKAELARNEQGEIIAPGCDDCDRAFIYADAPQATGRFVPGAPRTYDTARVNQRIEVKDLNTGEVADSHFHTVTIGAT